MADFLISAVSATYTGTNGDDGFRAATGNITDVTVLGLDGSDTVILGSASNAGTGAGGVGLGYAVQSSTFSLGSGNDTFSYSGQTQSGLPILRNVTISGDAGSDFIFLNGLQSAQNLTILAGDGADEVRFFATGTRSGDAFNVARTAENIWINGNAGDDAITANWIGGFGGDSAIAKSFRIEGGRDADTISAQFADVAILTAAATNQSGVRVQGNKGDDLVNVTFITGETGTNVVVNGNSGSDTVGFSAVGYTLTSAQIRGGRGIDNISANVGNASVDGVATYGDDGADVTVLTVAQNGAGTHVSGIGAYGGDGNDNVTLNFAASGGVANGFVITASNVVIDGDSGSNTLELVLNSNFVLTGQSSFVAQLSDSDTVGSLFTLSAATGLALVASGGATANQALFVHGATANDTINIFQRSGGSIEGTVISAEDGADSISLQATQSGSMTGLSVFAGSGDDTIRWSGANLVGDAGVSAGSTIGNVQLHGGDGADSISLNVYGRVTDAAITLGSGNDFIEGVVYSAGNQFGDASSTIVGGDGNDTIRIVTVTGSAAAINVLGTYTLGTGNDVLTASLGGTTVFNVLANFGDGADTVDIKVNHTANAGGDQVLSGATFNLGTGNDSLTIAYSAQEAGLSTYTAGMGTINGGDGDDSINLILNSAGAVGTLNISANVGGYTGTDLITIGGLTGGLAELSGLDFRFLSATTNMSAAGAQDTINFTQTSGPATLQSASITFADMWWGPGGNIATAFHNATAAGQALVVVTAGGSVKRAGAGLWANTGGFIAGHTAGDHEGFTAREFNFIATGGSTTANIFSAVNAVVGDVGGKAAVFNIQAGSGGTTQSYFWLGGGLFGTTQAIQLNQTLQAAGATNTLFGNETTSVVLDSVAAVSGGAMWDFKAGAA